MFVTSLHVSQETGELDLAESALQAYHPSRLSFYRQIKKTSINPKRNLREEKKPFEFTFRKSRPKQ